jgi:quercetin dioxygenase-like cupin family protein
MSESLEPIVRRVGETNAVHLGPTRVTFLVRGTDTAGRYSLTEFEAAPPPAPAALVHRHRDADEAIYVLEGEFALTIESQSRPMPPGSLVVVPRDTWHTITNVGNRSGRLLVILTPPGFEGYWEEMSRLLAASSGRPDASLVLSLQQKYHMDSEGQARQFT